MNVQQAQMVNVGTVNKLRARCIFCKIIEDGDGSKIVYEDDDLVVFPDIKPAASSHFLVVPKNHLPAAKYLDPEHIKLVEKMEEVAKKVLSEDDCDLDDVSIGFHWPPFNSISHLHLHAIGPQSEMGFFSRVLVYRENCWWYVSPQRVIRRLSLQEEEEEEEPQRVIRRLSLQEEEEED